MRPDLLKTTLTSLVRIGRTVAIEGAPGGGKTSIVNEVAHELGKPLIHLHMPTMPVEDFGVPWPNADEPNFEYKMPHWYPYEGKPGTEGGGIILFDDRNQASADIQKVLANICQAHELHGVPLAKGWTCVSTGNRQQDRAGANRVLTQLRNRETVLEFETHLDDSTSWMLDNGVRPEVVSFLRFRPNLLHDFDPQRDQNPTPRSWVEGVSPVLGEVPAEAEYECFKGAVGEGAAAEFVGFMKVFRKLPKPDAVLLDPSNHPVPEDVATLYALSGALAARANNGNFERVVTYADRMPSEFSVLTVTMATRRDESLYDTAAFVRWGERNQSVLF